MDKQNNLQDNWSQWSIYILKELERLDAEGKSTLSKLDNTNKILKDELITRLDKTDEKVDKLRHFRTTMITIWLVTDFLIMLAIAFKDRLFK